MILRSIATAALLLAGACGGTPEGPTNPDTPLATFASTHFVFRYPPGDQAVVPSIASAVEREYTRILDDLRATAMPAVTVTLYADHAALEAAVRPIVGTIPSFASGLVTSSTAIHMMSPSAPGWGPLDRMQSNLVHEFAHGVSLHLNPRIANNPRWLWESVAIYEARQSVDLRSVSYMAALDPPSFESMASVDNTRIYDVGYSIAEFIVSRWGQAALTQLVAANGDTASALGVPLADFQRQWFAFVRQRYGL
jgi:hypothetical protein